MILSASLRSVVKRVFRNAAGLFLICSELSSAKAVNLENIDISLGYTEAPATLTGRVLIPDIHLTPGLEVHASCGCVSHKLIPSTNGLTLSVAVDVGSDLHGFQKHVIRIHDKSEGLLATIALKYFVYRKGQFLVNPSVLRPTADSDSRVLFQVTGLKEAMTGLSVKPSILGNVRAISEVSASEIDGVLTQGFELTGPVQTSFQINVSSSWGSTPIQVLAIEPRRQDTKPALFFGMIPESGRAVKVSLPFSRTARVESSRDDIDVSLIQKELEGKFEYELFLRPLAGNNRIIDVELRFFSVPENELLYVAKAKGLRSK